MTGRAKQAAVVALKDVRQRLRDRAAVVAALIAPVVLAAIATTSLFRLPTAFHVTVAVADNDGGAVFQLLSDGVRNDRQAAAVVTLRQVASAERAREDARRGDVAAAILVPAGFARDALAGRLVRPDVVGSDEHPVGATVAGALVDAFTAQLAADQQSVRTVMALTEPTGQPASELVIRAGKLQLPVAATPTWPATSVRRWRWRCC